MAIGGSMSHQTLIDELKKARSYTDIEDKLDVVIEALIFLLRRD